MGSYPYDRPTRHPPVHDDRPETQTVIISAFPSIRELFMNNSQQALNTKLNQETGRLTWPDLERHFARGVVIRVDAGLDLVEVAARMSMDDKAATRQWLDEGLVDKANDDDARRWHETKVEFWAVVTAPWVLVQEIGPEQ